MPSKRGASESFESPTKRVKSGNSQSTMLNEIAPPLKVDFRTSNPQKPPRGKKKAMKEEMKSSDANAEHHVSPFKAKYHPEMSLDRLYKVDPVQEWSEMRKYSKFVLLGHTYVVHSYVAVQADPDEKATAKGPAPHWVGRVLEIRAMDQQRVYALVCWMYWPVELPTGKKPYHGVNEVIASNHIDVIDVLTISAPVTVSHWSEEDDDPGSGYYWRQIHDETTGELSKIRPHCTCNGFFNPNVPMYTCDNDKCKFLRHTECIVDDVLTAVYKKQSKENGTPNGLQNHKKAKKRPYTGIFSGKVIDEEGTSLKVEVTDMTSKKNKATREKWTENVPCPKCGTELQS